MMQVQQQDASDIIVPAAAAWQRENSDDPDIPVAVAMEAAPTMDEINIRANPILTSQLSAPLKDDWMECGGADQAHRAPAAARPCLPASKTSRTALYGSSG